MNSEHLSSHLMLSNPFMEILVQLPLPKHLDAGPIVQSIRSEKDVDLHVVNVGSYWRPENRHGLVHPGRDNGLR